MCVESVHGCLDSSTWQKVSPPPVAKTFASLSNWHKFTINTTIYRSRWPVIWESLSHIQFQEIVILQIFAPGQPLLPEWKWCWKEYECHWQVRNHNKLFTEVPRLKFSSCHRRGSIVNKNNIGDKTEPCRKSLSGEETDRSFPILTHQTLLVYQAFRSLRTLPFIPASCRQFGSTGNSTESNAFCRSYRSNYLLSHTISYVAKIALAQETFFLYADWLIVEFLLLSRCPASSPAPETHKGQGDVTVTVHPEKVFATSFIHRHYISHFQNLRHNFKLNYGIQHLFQPHY